MPAGKSSEEDAAESGTSASATGISSLVSVHTAWYRRTSDMVSSPVTWSETVSAWPVEFETLTAPARVSPFMARIDTVSGPPAAGGLSSGRTKSHGLTTHAVNG